MGMARLFFHRCAPQRRLPLRADLRCVTPCLQSQAFHCLSLTPLVGWFKLGHPAGCTDDFTGKAMILLTKQTPLCPHPSLPCALCINSLRGGVVCRPVLAVLDECTNAVSTDVERSLFEHAMSLGCTLITVTQRPALTHLHRLELQLLDGAGHWQLCELEHGSVAPEAGG
jgi:hypothetical protein